MRRAPHEPTGVRDAPSLTPSLMQAVQRLELHLGGMADSIIHGDRLSHFPGRGLEAAGVREYQPGDEARGIDWRVTARKGRLHVREFHEDRDLPFVVLFHRSPTLRAGRAGIKETRAVEVAGLLAALSLKGGNRIGLVHGGPGRLLLPSRNKRQLLHFLTVLLSVPQEESEASLAELLKSFTQGKRERHRVFLVSDFLLDGPEVFRVRERLLALRRRHSLTPVRILDRREGDLPESFWFYLRDPVTGDLTRPRTREGKRSLRVELDRVADRVEGLFRELGIREWSFDVAEGLKPRLRALLAQDRREGHRRA